MMRFSLAALCFVAAQAQTGPVVNPRGVINKFTQEPALTTVAPGGILQINGINLGPPEGATSGGAPLPTRLADVEVLINGRNAPLFSVSPGRIEVQVPWETNVGTAELVVKRGDQTTRPARFQVVAAHPALHTLNNAGYAEVAATGDAQVIVSATDLGRTDPQVDSGSAGPPDIQATPRSPLRVYLGGTLTNATAALSTGRVGEFDVKLDLPSTASPGDVIELVSGNRVPGNRATYKSLATAVVGFVPMPDGAPELRAMAGSDLRPGYLIGSGARDSDGCYPSVLFDLNKKTAAKVDGCLTAGNRNVQIPVVAANEGNALAALVGPPEGEAPAGVSSKVMVFNPGADAPMVAQLPAPATGVLNGQLGNFFALIPGDPAQVVEVDANTAAVGDPRNAGGGGNTVVLPQNLDLGNGLTHRLSRYVSLPQGFATVVGDDPDKPANAKVALLNDTGEVTGARDFPEGWLPLVAPRPPNIPGGGVGIPNPLAAIAVTVTYDGPTGSLYVISRAADASRDGLVAFGESDTNVARFPDGWFAASCTTAVAIQQLDLVRRAAIAGSSSVETEVKQNCPAQAFLVFDYATQAFTAVPLPGQGEMNATTVGELNNYLHATNSDPQRRTADTLFVLDGPTNSAFKLDLPTGVTSFAGVTEVGALNALLSLATNRAAGDAGIIYFDLDNAAARLFPVPDGFATVEALGVFLTTRKLVAHGVKNGDSGSQYLIYDLLTGDLQMPPNPEGVAFVGSLPPQGQPGPGNAPVMLQRAHVKANVIEAVGFSSDRKQVGVLMVRVP